MKHLRIAALAASISFSALVYAQDCTVYDLQSEYMPDPLGIDADKPRFSWKMKDDRPAARQQGYQLQVATSKEKLEAGEADVWDSGKVTGTASNEIVYSGPALKPLTTYYWRVQVTDLEGKEAPFSEIALFETGFMDTEKWQGKWIAGLHEEEVAEATMEGVKWIWYAEEGDPSKKAPKGKRYFQKEFEVPEGELESALSWGLMDDHGVIYINGQRAHNVVAWQGLAKHDVLKLLKPGKNLVQVTVNNDAENPAGLAWALELVTADGKKQRVLTDKDWKSSVQPGADWPEDGAGTAEWKDVTVMGDIGMEPWKKPVVAVDGGPASLHRKDFKVENPVKSARLYITALGSYQATVNGKPVTDAILTPEWTDYRERVIYQTYDVSGLVSEGDNAIGVTLGDGWYATGLGWQLQRYMFDEPPTRFIAELHLNYADGTSKVVASDASWKTAESPIKRSEYYYGEIYDAQDEIDGWNLAGFDDSKWKESRTPKTKELDFDGQQSPPIRVTQEITPIAITEPEPGVYVYDMGQNMVGWATLNVKGKAGDKVRMRFAEILEKDGNIYRDNLRRAEATDTYILKGDENGETFEPHFTYHGFRYVEVTGYPGGKPALDALTGRVFHSDVKKIGTFETSDKLVNRIAQNTLWGLRGNLHSVPTDCPQRDERLGWTADAMAIWLTACYNMDMTAFAEKWLIDVRDAQLPDGAYTNVVPRVVVDAPGAPAWGDGCLIVPYQTWMMYGNTRIIEDAWDSMEDWLAYVHKHNPNFLWKNNRGPDFGDWVPANSETDKSLIGTAYWANNARMMSHMAKALNKPDKVKQYDELYENIKSAFQKEYIAEDGKIANGSQTCYVLALNSGLVQPEMVETAVTHLVDDITSRGNHLSTGFLGSTYLMPMLTEHDKLDVAYTLLLNKTYPSWGYMVEKGATTVWERWNSDTGDPSMNSFNHYTYGAVVDWMYRYLGGIRPLEPGFAKILVEPYPEKRIEWVKTDYDSVRGNIKSAWKHEGDKVHFDITIPANSEAEISLPASSPAKVTTEGKSLDAAGLKAEVRDGRTIIPVKAGTYSFVVSQ